MAPSLPAIPAAAYPHPDAGRDTLAPIRPLPFPRNTPNRPPAPRSRLQTVAPACQLGGEWILGSHYRAAQPLPTTDGTSRAWPPRQPATTSRIGHWGATIGWCPRVPQGARRVRGALQHRDRPHQVRPMQCVRQTGRRQYFRTAPATPAACRSSRRYPADSDP